MAKIMELEPAPDDRLHRRARALLEAGELDEAFEQLQALLTTDPNDAHALVLTAEALKKARKLPLAYTLARRATELRPERAEPWGAFGHAAQQLWRLDEALSAYRKALQRSRTDKQRALYQNNLASTHLDAGRFKAAEQPAREAIALDPEDGAARHNLGLSLLAQRRWAEAWPNYSASVGSKVRLNIKYLPDPEPTWDGSPGKTVVVYGEQGLGDEINAASMLPDAIRDCRRVIVDCDPRLANLFRRSFPAATVHGTRQAKELSWPEADRRIDASISAFEIGRFYRNAAADFPGTAYLTPCPDRTAMWRALFASKGKPTIGIAWTGGTFQNAGQYRALPLKDWAPLFGAVDAHWVSLQYKSAAEEIRGTPVEEYGYATLTKDYDDTAALVAACDLVICVQTSVGHLAGALGKPAWVMVPPQTQWRYGEEWTDTPWYRSVKLYRAPGGRWPLATLANDLRRHFAHQ
jgi:tetratricopeptide (TPR) repeat protein